MIDLVFKIEGLVCNVGIYVVVVVIGDKLLMEYVLFGRVFGKDDVIM